MAHCSGLGSLCMLMISLVTDYWAPYFKQLALYTALEASLPGSLTKKKRRKQANERNWYQNEKKLSEEHFQLEISVIKDRPRL